MRDDVTRRGIELDVALSELEKINRRSIRTVGSEKRSIFGGFSDANHGTSAMPACDFHSLVILNRGTAKFEIENGWLTPPPRSHAAYDFVLIPAGNAISATVRDKVQTKASGSFEDVAPMFLVFPTELLQTALENVSGTEVDPDEVLKGLFTRPSMTFRALAGALREELRHEKHGDRTMFDALTNGLMIELARAHHEAANKAVVSEGFCDKQMDLVVDLFNAALDGSIKLRDVADQMSLKPSTFTRRFRESFNLTPSEYLSSMRLSNARQYLIETENSIADIAYSSGFSSQAHLTTRFSTEFGMTPAKFRAKFRGQDAS